MSTRFLPSEHSLVVVDSDDAARQILCGRLRAQGYRVHSMASSAEAASLALAEPPSAVVSKLWMPSISGVQLCHLLKAEAATADVPVLLMGDGYSPRARFWAEQSGAAYVHSGELGELMRTLARCIEAAPTGDGFFTMLGNVDVRDRIAAELDRRLFDSLLAAEVRALAACDSFERLFDQLSQLMCRQCPYGWVALATSGGERMGVHARPGARDAAIAAAREALRAPKARVSSVLDDDARPAQEGDAVRTAVVHFGSDELGRLAISADATDPEVRTILALVATELGLPLRVSLLVEETRKLALYDPLTGVMNRRAFLQAMTAPERSRRPYAIAVLDVDHFKAVNDNYGHAGGDAVLQELGGLLRERVQRYDAVACRWGGEEFVLAISGRSADSGRRIAEELRVEIEALELTAPDGTPFRITASIGLASGRSGEPLQTVVDRADAQLYMAKEGGRNQVRAA